MNSRISWLMIIILAAMLTACSVGSDTTPVSGDIDAPTITGSTDLSRDASGRILWGLYEIALDPTDLSADVIPLRSAEFNANVTQFMHPPLSPTNRLSIYIDGGASNLTEGLFAVDVTLNHPFPGLAKYSGFDVRGIFMADGSTSSDGYSGILYAGDDESYLENPDGWTRWWNPGEFTTYETIFGYTTGKFASPGFLASATLNPFKYFCDGLESEDPFTVDPETRGFFSTVPGSNTRRYMIQFAMEDDSPVVRFNYAVDAGWEDPVGEGPDYEVDDWTLSANCQEAYRIAVDDADSTAWWISETENGGDLSIDITVFDWQASENPDGVPGEVAGIYLESNGIFDGQIDVLPIATVSPDGPTSSVYHVDIADVTPTGLTDQKIMVSVESEHPSGYEPNLDGIAGFDYPDASLAAFTFWDAPVINEEPPPLIPTPVGVDNCAAAGVVKIFWDEVVWATLDGYNVYRKLSSEPDFDFGSPLNTSIIHDTEYIDDSVLMDGTTYDYVVTAVDVSTAESDPSDTTVADPGYYTPTGFTDLDNPDGELGTYNTSDFVNTFLAADGTIYSTYAYPTRFVRSHIDDLSTYTEIYLGSTFYGRWADVAADSDGNAHVCWTNQYSTGRHYYYAMIAPDNSISNSATIHSFTATSGWEGESSIAVTPDGEVHIVFPTYDGSTYGLGYVHGMPGSLSSAEVITTQVYTDIYNMRPDLTSDRFGNVHAAWYGPGNEIYYMKRDSSGTWDSPENVTGSLSGYHQWPAIAADFEGTVHISWHTIAYYPGYANNRSGSWQGQLLTGMSSGNCVGVGCDRDGNAYVDSYRNGEVFVTLIDRDNNVVETAKINDDMPQDGSWCSFAGQSDPCYNEGVLAVWRDFPPSPGIKYGRIQADY